MALVDQVHALIAQAHDEGRHEQAQVKLKQIDYDRVAMCGIAADLVHALADGWLRADSEAAHVLFDAEKALRELGDQPHPMTPAPPVLPDLPSDDG